MLSVRIDRGAARRARVRRAWRTYRWRLRAPAGRHRVAVVLANPGGVRRRCARRLVVGRIALSERGGGHAKPATQPSGAPPAALPPAVPGPLDAFPAESLPYRYGGRYAGAFNEPIPADATTDPASTAVVAAMTDAMTRERVAMLDEGGVPGVWVAGPGDATYTIHAGGATFGWRVPAGATPGGSLADDAPLVVLDPSHPKYGPRVELRLFRATIDHAARTISAQGYGLFRYGRESDGLPFAGYGTGSGLSWVGLLRGWDVAQGEIRHALRMTAPQISARHRLPATRSDQGDSSPIDMGMRLQLDPAVDCAARTVPGRDPSGPETRMLRMVCRALQRYGVVIVDGSGQANRYALLMELDASHGGTVDWSALGGDPPGGYWGNLIRDELADQTGDGLDRSPTDGIPWARMRVLATGVFSR